MRSVALASTVLCVAFCAGPALADGTPPAGAAPAPSPTYTMATHDVVIRVAKPAVLVDIKRPTAAAEAGAAHEGLRASLLLQSVPPAMKTK